MHDQKLTRLFERYRSKNDLAALAEVFDEVSPELLRVARHLAGRNLDPEDLVQGTFLSAIEHAHSYDTERPLVPWLLGILTNLSRSARRRASTHIAEEVEEGLAAGTRPVDDAEAHEIDHAVHDALAQLPETYREVLVPHLAEGKKPHQIARDLGRPQGTVRAQIHRGIRLLRRSLPAGLSFGFVALLAPDSLAAVRARVLAEAARSAGLPPTDAARLGQEAARRLLLRRTAAVALTIAAGVALWLAWPARGSEVRADRIAARDGSPDERTLEGAGAETSRRALGANSAPAEVSGASAAASSGAVTVHVVDDADGRPVAGARVRLIAWGDAAWFETWREARTVSDGTARFERVSPGRVGVLVDDGAQLRADVERGVTSVVEARRASDVIVSARVVDARGSPVAGAVVEAFDERAGDPVATSAPTDADGRVALTGLHARQWVAARVAGGGGSRLVALASPAYARDEARGSAPVIVFTLLSGGRALHGHVVDGAGRPVTGARVRVSAPAREDPEFGADGAPCFERAPRVGVTDERGAFALAGLPDAAPTDFDVLRVEADGYAVVERATTPAGNASDEQRIVLTRAARVHGVVRFPDGAPAAFAEVRAEPESTEPSSAAGPEARASDAGMSARRTVPVVTARADGNGAFALEGIGAGRVVVGARAGGIGPVSQATLELAPGDAREWMPVVEHVSVIRGRAIGEDGRLVKTWLVLAVPEDESPADRSSRSFAAALLPSTASMALQCWIDLKGNYVVPCLGTGPHRIELRPREAWQGPVQAVREHVMPGSLGVDLRVARARGLAHGRIVVPAGLSAVVAAVTSHSRAVAGVGRAAWNRADGTYRLDLVPGEHDLVAWMVNGRPRVIGTVLVQGVERVDVPDFVLAAPGSVAITIDAAEEPRDVELRRTLAGGARTAFPIALGRQADGSWAAEDVQPGTYECVVEDAHGRRREQPIEVRAGERTSLRVER